MENFFYGDKFCNDIDSLMVELDIDDDIDSLSDLEDDWVVTCEESNLEKIFIIKKEFAVKAIINRTDMWDARFPDDSDCLFERIEKAIGDAIDIDKLNENLPSLYYANGNMFNITKADLINWCK